LAGCVAGDWSGDRSVYGGCASRDYAGGRSDRIGRERDKGALYGVEEGGEGEFGAGGAVEAGGDCVEGGLAASE